MDDTSLSTRQFARDPLTGLPGLYEFLQLLMAREAEDRANGSFPNTTCVYFNVRNFRVYNTFHGIGGGDDCLKGIAHILRSVFPTDPICRSSADNFLVQTHNDGALERVKQACAQADDFICTPGVTLKAGVRIAQVGDKVGSDLLDQAKIACASIREDNRRSWALYDAKMDQYLSDRDYVLANFDRALANGDIKVAFQPVVRTLTGKFCNSEALARWEAPDHGRLTPDVFVKVLEDAGRVQELDKFVLERCAQVLRYELDNGIPIVPISVNFSRVDFQVMDVFEEVRSIVQKYDLAPHLICVEVTETALLQDSVPLTNAINALREAGFQVWLDDFGSGYSSLNVLQNFHFDEIKLDMGFMRDYGEANRKAIKAIVVMAKTLGPRTLAEGVETREQVEFLKSIGCEKIQGYYYAKPMYLDSAVSYPGQREIQVEAPDETQLFETAGAINMVTDGSLALSIVDGENHRIIFANDAYRRDILATGFQSLEHLNQALAASSATAYERFRHTAITAIRDGSASILFLENGHYMRLAMQRLSRAGRLSLLKVELTELNRDAPNNISLYDQQTRNFMSRYGSIYYLPASLQTAEVIRSALPNFSAGDSVPVSPELIAAFTEKFVHPRDRARFQRFMQPSRIREAAEASPYHEASSMFRIRQPDGSYKWMIYDVVVLTGTDEGSALMVAREDTLPYMVEAQEMLREYALSSESVELPL